MTLTPSFNRPPKRPYRHHDPQAVFDFIVAYKRANDGNSPSIREIGEQFEASTSAVHNVLGRIEKRGLIKYNHATARGLVVIGGEWKFSHAQKETENKAAQAQEAQYPLSSERVLLTGEKQ